MFVFARKIPALGGGCLISFKIFYGFPSFMQALRAHKRSAPGRSSVIYFPLDDRLLVPHLITFDIISYFYHRTRSVRGWSTLIYKHFIIVLNVKIGLYITKDMIYCHVPCLGPRVTARWPRAPRLLTRGSLRSSLHHDSRMKWYWCRAWY